MVLHECYNMVSSWIIMVVYNHLIPFYNHLLTGMQIVANQPNKLICIYIYIHAYQQIHICTYIYMYLNVFTYIYIYLHVYI